VTSQASQTHNVLAASFIPGSFKGILFLSGPAMVAHDQGENLGPELSVLANSLIRDFGGQAPFIYTLPGADLAPKITAPKDIGGASRAIEIQDWTDFEKVLEAIAE
jgi:hypothetical protein